MSHHPLTLARRLADAHDEGASDWNCCAMVHAFRRLDHLITTAGAVINPERLEKLVVLERLVNVHMQLGLATGSSGPYARLSELGHDVVEWAQDHDFTAVRGRDFRRR